jgi:hypothetical protein
MKNKSNIKENEIARHYIRIKEGKRPTFKIHENTILSAPRLTLPNNDSRHNLLPEIRLPLLDSGHYHITNASRRQAVQATLNSLHGYDVKVLSTSVISTVHCCCHWQTQ